MELDRIVRRQQGLITRQQVLECGISSSAWGRRLQQGSFERMLPGVYLVTTAFRSHEVALRATILWLGSEATVSGAWAGWRHGLLDAPRGPVTVTIPRTRSIGAQALVTVRRRDLAPPDRVMLRGSWVTTRALTALECAGLPNGEDAVDRALQLGTTRTSLLSSMERLTSARGAPAARAAVVRTADGAVSPAERVFSQLMRSANIHELQAGLWVRLDGHAYWLDFGSEALRLGVEIDGWTAHSSGPAFHRDRARQNRFVAHGWTLLRYTPLQLREDPGDVLAEVQHVIAARRRARRTWTESSR